MWATGTGGSISGIGRALKARNSKVQVIGVEPARSPILTKGEKGQHRFQGMGPGFIPKNLDQGVLDEVIAVYEEDAFPLARRHTLPQGPWLSANYTAAGEKNQHSSHKLHRIAS